MRGKHRLWLYYSSVTENRGGANTDGDVFRNIKRRQVNP